LSRVGWLLLAAIVLLGAAGILAYPRFEGSAPRIEGPAELIVGAAGATISLEISDAGTGLRSVEIALRQGEASHSLATQSWPGSLLGGGFDGQDEPVAVEIQIDPKALKLGEGRATLVVSARDWSWRGSLTGNLGEFEIPIEIDTTPPRIEPMGGIVYIYRGGSGAMTYRVRAGAERDGIRVGERFYRGYPIPGTSADDGDRIALFAIAVDSAANPRVVLEAADAAGNIATARPPVKVFDRKFSKEQLNLSARFFANVIPDLAERLGVTAPDNVAAFQIINRDIRAKNEEQIQREIQPSADAPAWSGAFHQLVNSKVMSHFAEQRSYFSEGRPISEATHYGFDLASRSQTPILAANAGRVLYADELGIYGNCILIDHGMGLVSLYAHLSSMDVAPGDVVEQDQMLGRSGATGLAGGDHLHFAILVGGTYVDPLEWWDPRWVKTHVQARLEPSRP
jgi:murein DD-endopeptidase MepM/ murein hydrolase activator NlpD